MEEQTQSQSVPTQPASVSPILIKQGNKSLIITSVLVFLLMAGGLVYLGYQNYQLQQKLNQLLDNRVGEIQVTPTPTTVTETNSTNNWRIYTNEARGYSLQYPLDWTLDETAAQGEGGCEGPTFLSPTKESWLVVCRLDNSSGIAGSKSSWKNKTSVTDIIVDGHPAIQYEYQQFESQYEYNIEIENTSQRDLLWLHMIADTTEKESVKTNFDQVVSAFMFLN